MPHAAPLTAQSFDRLGPVSPSGPVVLAVPHAGRDYPAALQAMAAVPLARLEALEDRHADLLVTQATAASAITFVARRARCWIDLNRDEREVDAAMIDPPPAAAALSASARVRGGLGLIPRRLQGLGELWRGRVEAEDLAGRIARDHRPWHTALGEALEQARARFGAALLLDCHSMPPLSGKGEAADIVLGDRFGRSAASRIVERLAATAEAQGFRVAFNSPYAGGHALDRHGAPARGIHAVQIEVDRRLYLEADLRTPGPGLARVQALIAALAVAGADELAAPLGLAAE